MLIKTEELKQLTTESNDHIDGAVDDLYFDDLFWNIQYLLIRENAMLKDKNFLVSHAALGEPDVEGQKLPLKVFLSNGKGTRKPDTIRTISELREKNAMKILEWPLNQVNITTLNAEEVETLVTNMLPEEKEESRKANPHLRSRNEVLGYNIHARNGEIGHVNDFIVETQNWKIRYLIVDTRNWLPGGKDVLISPAWIQRIKWNNNLVHIDMRKEVIKDSPSYDSDEPLSDEFELKLFKYYGRERSRNK